MLKQEADDKILTTQLLNKKRMFNKNARPTKVHTVPCLLRSRMPPQRDRTARFIEIVDAQLWTRAVGCKCPVLGRIKGVLTVTREVLAIAWVATACWSASAAELTTLSKDNKTIVLLNGDLAAGDAGRVRDLLNASFAAGKPVSGIRLNSRGGSLVEGVRLAGVVHGANVHGAKIATVVMAGATCAAACFVPFIAGNQKYVSATATVDAPGAAAPREPSGEPARRSPRPR